MQGELSTLIHFVKSCLASGILAIPFAFSNAGLVFGTVGTIVVGIICTHCAYTLVVCAQELRQRSERNPLTFAEVAEEACLIGHKKLRPYHKLARGTVDLLLFTTYFGISSAYIVIMSKHFDKIISYYWFPVNIRIYIASTLIPLLLLSYIPNLKYLTPVSMMANLFLALGLGITMYYLVQDMPSDSSIKMVEDVTKIPKFFSIMIFSLETIGCVMPIENNMKRPQNYVGPFGVLNQGMLIIILVHIIVGVLGYLRFGDETLANITLNLPNDEYLAQAVQIFIALSVFGTFGIQFFVCLQIAWNHIKHRYDKHPTIANYLLRTVLVILAILLALAVPTIGPFISLIGALCFSLTGIVLPIFIEIITFWEQGFGAFYWKLIKDVFVVIIGVFALVVGTRDAISDILDFKMFNYSYLTIMLRSLLIIVLFGHIIPSASSNIHHRIIIKNYRRPMKDYKKSHSDYYHKKKSPASYNSEEENSSDYTPYHQEIPSHAYKNEHFRNKTKKSHRHNHHSSIRLTTAFPSDLTVPLYESTFSDYFPVPNKTLDLDAKGSQTNFDFRHVQLNNLLNKLVENSKRGKENQSDSIDQQHANYQVHEDIDDSRFSLPKFSGPTSNYKAWPFHNLHSRDNFNGGKRNG